MGKSTQSQKRETLTVKKLTGTQCRQQKTAIKTDAGSFTINIHYYYLDLPMPIAAHYFVGLVDGEPVAHVAVAPFFQCGYYRAARLAVMPEWQGAGIGTRFLNAVCQWHLDGNGRCGKKVPVLFHTSYPQLATVLRRSPPFGFRKARRFTRSLAQK